MRELTRVEIVGYACWVIGIISLLLVLLPYFDIGVRIYLSASGLAIFGIYNFRKKTILNSAMILTRNIIVIESSLLAIL